MAVEGSITTGAPPAFEQVNLRGLRELRLLGYILGEGGGSALIAPDFKGPHNKHSNNMLCGAYETPCFHKCTPDGYQSPKPKGHHLLRPQTPNT